MNGIVPLSLAVWIGLQDVSIVFIHDSKRETEIRNASLQFWISVILIIFQTAHVVLIIFLYWNAKVRWKKGKKITTFCQCHLDLILQHVVFGELVPTWATWAWLEPMWGTQQQQQQQTPSLQTPTNGTTLADYQLLAWFVNSLRHQVLHKSFLHY